MPCSSHATSQTFNEFQTYKSLIGRNNKISLPLLEVQEEIAAHIQSIRERAGELERDAHREVERDKWEVKQMILGEASADA